MATLNLDKIFRPKRVAVIGASDTPNSIGSIVLRNLIGESFDRVIYPVNSERESVHGVQAYPDLASVPKLPELAVVCSAATEVPGIVAECGQAGVGGMLILSTGFTEVGPQGQKLEDQVRQEARRFPQMRIIGPNSYGIIVPRLNLNASVASGIPKEGHVAFVSQSKALCASTLDWALKEHVGFSHFVSIGNAIDVSFSDLIDYLGNEPRTLALILYVLSIHNVREFMSAARAFAQSKPIVAYKSGRFVRSAEAVVLHTGAMVGEDAVYDAAFERAGIVRVSETDDIFDCAELLARQRTPRGARLSILTNAGEPGRVAADALLERHGSLAMLSPAIREQLAELLLANVTYSNPGHLSRDATAEEYGRATALVLQDSDVDAVLAIFTPRGTTSPTSVAQAVSEVGSKSVKPVLAAWMGGQAVQEGVQVLNQSGVPVYNTPEQAICSFMYLLSYARNKETLYETPRDIPVSFTPRRGKLRGFVLKQEKELLSERLSKALLRTYGIPTTKPFLARTADEAVRIARRIGFPVVLKVYSPQITYKTEVGGIALNLTTETGVRAHFEQIVADAKRHCPDASIEGGTVQRMIVAPSGFELILGSKRDRTFGAVLMVGMGGIATEIIHDRALGLPPLNERLARRMLESLHSWPLLQGYRGRPGINVDRLIEILMRLSYLVADHPEIRELDINPLLMTPEDAIALDARIRIDRGEMKRPGRPYAHLAIRPYPEEYVRTAQLKDGQPVVLRPIKPEDEPAWQQLLAACSDESIRLRFRALVKRTAHEVATRYCFIDYDRDMAIVAEVGGQERPTIIGIGNLFGEPDGESAEYAILVADNWQGYGLGDLLTTACMQVADHWELKSVYAETTADNLRMMSLFQKQGFQIQQQRADQSVVVKKTLRE